MGTFLFGGAKVPLATASDVTEGTSTTAAITPKSLADSTPTFNGSLLTNLPAGGGLRWDADFSTDGDVKGAALPSGMVLLNGAALDAATAASGIITFDHGATSTKFTSGDTAPILYAKFSHDPRYPFVATARIAGSTIDQNFESAGLAIWLDTDTKGSGSMGLVAVQSNGASFLATHHSSYANAGSLTKTDPFWVRITIDPIRYFAIYEGNTDSGTTEPTSGWTYIYRYSTAWPFYWDTGVYRVGLFGATQNTLDNFSCSFSALSVDGGNLLS